jgi:hypothetical protein
MDSLTRLLGILGHLPPTPRLLAWAAKSLGQQKLDSSAFMEGLRTISPEHQWKHIANSLPQGVLDNLEKQLEKEMLPLYEKEICRCKIKQGDGVIYTGRDNLLRMLKGKTLYVRSVQGAQGIIWTTCGTDGILDQTFPVEQAKKIFLS